VKTTKWFVSSILLIALSVVMIGQGAAQTQDPPDLTGTWRLNVEKSKFRKGTTIKPETLVIKCIGLAIEMYSVTDGKRYLQAFTADGQQKRIPMGPTGELLTTTQWKDRTLIIATQLMAYLPGIGKQELQSSKDRWRMSEDGKTLVDEEMGTKHFAWYEKSSP
jgi:hypothetical protein